MELLEIHTYLSDKYGLDMVTQPERSELGIAYPDVPMKAVNIETTVDWAEWNREFNLFRGDRAQYGVMAGNDSADRVFTFTLPDSDLCSVDYIYLAHADFLINSGDINLTVEFKNVSGLWQMCHEDTLTANKLKGRFGSDYFANTYDFGPRKEWRVTLSGSSGTSTYCKLYLGKLWTPGTWPDQFTFDYIVQDSTPFISDSGARLATKSSTARYMGRYEWQGISEAKLQELFNKKALMRTEARGVVLYNPLQTKITDHHEIVHAEVTELQHEDRFAWPDWRTIKLAILEYIG
jgi:hypothetical protein